MLRRQPIRVLFGERSLLYRYDVLQQLDRLINLPVCSVGAGESTLRHQLIRVLFSERPLFNGYDVL